MGDRYETRAAEILRSLDGNWFDNVERIARELREFDWLPIKTAPKDGTPILTWGCLHDDGGIDMGERPAMQISRWIEMYKSWVSGDWGSHAPVLWRPLPAPPPDTGRDTVTPRDTGGGDG